MSSSVVALWVLGCASAPDEAPDEASERDSVCALAFAPAPGPLSEEALGLTEPVELAMSRIREARLTNDDGFLTLAELALDCALSRDPSSVLARRYKGYVDLQFHRFAEAEKEMEVLVAQTDHASDHLLLGDARMEQGNLAGARASYELALDKRPNLEVYDRLAHLSWLQGDLPAALELGKLAFDASAGADPEVVAWVSVAYGTWKMYAGEVPNEIGLALSLLPDYRPAHLALGRYWLLLGDKGRAEHHLRAAGPTVAAVVALAEIDESVDVSAVSRQDRRGYGLWLAKSSPGEALPLLDAERAQRADALTVIGRAWVASRAGEAPEEQRSAVASALASGIADPTALLMAAEVTADPALAERALALPMGLLPSERERALDILEHQQISDPSSGEKRSQK